MLILGICLHDIVLCKGRGGNLHQPLKIVMFLKLLMVSKIKAEKQVEVKLRLKTEKCYDSWSTLYITDFKASEVRCYYIYLQ